MTKSGITRFKKDGQCPLSNVDTINKDKPLALITSLVDTEVPCQCTINLYKKLIEKGHTKVHLLILKNSSHSRYALDQNKEVYRNFIHAFYKKYNLPYVPEYADRGQGDLSQSQISEKKLNKLLLK